MKLTAENSKGAKNEIPSCAVDEGMYENDVCR